ncbi:Ribonuclease HI [Vitis vinifera]|uniref:Ribonuclease HI n=1 Tax=Vitis vinifera TaxID=29760 RepID=A0A438KBC5_VITVI|nr:Ribonuclease HI [Vitis vinifera]
MIMLFPMYLGGAAQRWFASLDVSRRRTWDDLAQEFLRQYAFNTVADVSRRELEALRQRSDESVSSFISRWRGKIAEIIDRPSERDQIQMVLRSLQPRIARHVVGVPFADFGSLVMALYDVEDGISRGLWTDSSPSDIKGKKPFVGSRPADVSAIGSSSQRLLRRHQPIPQFLEPHSSYASHQYRPRAPRPVYDQTYTPQTLALPYYASQGIERPSVSYTATGQPCYAAQFCETRSALSSTQSSADFCSLCFEDAEAVLTDRMDLHCAYHQGPGHETDRCTTLRHAVQDLIDQGLVHLGQPSVTTNPLPAHTTHAVPPPADGIHFLEFDVIDDHIHMLSDDDSDPEPIMPDVIYETSGVTLGPRMPAPFRLVPEAASVQAATVEPLILPHYSVQTPFILIPDDEGVQAPYVDDSQTLDIQYVLRGAEDDEILRQLQSTQARISIWSLLASSSTHRDALTRALSQIRVDTMTTPEGLIHMMTADRATCIVFSDDDLPPEVLAHTRPLYISIGCSGRRVPSVLLDNGSALNVCPLATAIALGTHHPISVHPLRSFELMTAPVLRIPTSFNLLLGRPWIHRAGAIPSSLHQKVKFIHEGQVVVVQSARDMFISAEPVLQISHSDDDLLLTGFTFDEACPIYPAWGWADVSMDRASSSPFLIMTYHLGSGSSPLRLIIDICTIAQGEGEGSTESCAVLLSCSPIHQESGRLLCEGIRAACIIDGIIRGLSTTQEAELQHLVQQLRLRDGAPGPSTSALIAHSSPDRTSLMTLCFPDETDEHETFAESIFDIDDEIAQHDSDDDSSSASDSDPVDQRVSPTVGDTEIVDFGTADQLGSLDPSIVQHRLPLLPHARPVKQKLRRLHPRWSLQVKEEIQKQLSVGFLSVVEYPSGWPMSSLFQRTARTWRRRPSLPSGVLIAIESCHSIEERRSTYQRAATTLFHELMHRDVEVYVDDMIVKSRDRSDHLAALESERGIEVDPDKIRAILDMPAPRTEREVRGFLGRLQYISRFIARLTDICEPIFRLLRKSQPTVWDDQCQRALRGSESTCCHLLFWRLLHQAVLYSYTCPYQTWPWVAFHQREHCSRSSSSLPVSDARAIDDDFPDEDVAAVTSLSGWRMYFDGAANHSGYGIGVLLISPHGDHIPRSVRLAFSDRHPATNNIVEYEACILGLETALELGIRQMEVFGDSNLVLRQIQGEWKTRDVKLKPYHAYLELLVGRFDDLRYTHLPRAQNQFADALATLASMIDIPVDATVRPLLIESRSAPAYCCLIDDVEPDDGLPWYHDIYHFLRLGVYPEAATAKDKRALRQLATRFVICGETLYRRSPDGMLLLCLDRASADRVMREVHAGVCGPHMEDICWLVRS